MSSGLSNLGIVHTAISLVAVAAGLIALARDGQIVSGNRIGRLYLWATVLTCLTGFGIFAHGGFGKPHALGVLTLIVLGIAWGAGRLGWFGRAAPYVEVVAYSTSFMFHWIPAITETTTRLPLGAPLLASPEAPQLQAVAGLLFMLLIVGVTLQLRRLRRRLGAGGAALAA
ncbi:hypothetical protein [Roseateles violae]|uniref:DUF2306 domain-containing protein n=1 Tax=Roseateles violae TaxID=3058042 RepID=A0ABT8DTL3_9BURK|nr:hypothetical protein [Pelomonas sp. PFR6]MDN3921411.1 hypothetical protein [Pelomonas sp. PFR6]